MFLLHLVPATLLRPLRRRFLFGRLMAFYRLPRHRRDEARLRLNWREIDYLDTRLRWLTYELDQAARSLLETDPEQLVRARFRIARMKYRLDMLRVRAGRLPTRPIETIRSW